MVVAASCSGLQPSSMARTWLATTASVMPCSRSDRSSPQQAIGLRPASAAAFSLRFTVASLSPNTDCISSVKSSVTAPKRPRLSEWPTMTKLQPHDSSMSAEISPVKAPEGSQKRFCPPRAIGVSAIAWLTALSAVNGGHITASQAAPSQAHFAMPSARATAAELSQFIFQFPAIIGVLIRYLPQSVHMHAVAARMAGIICRQVLPRRTECHPRDTLEMHLRRWIYDLWRRPRPSE